MARYIDKDKVLNRLRYLCEVTSEPPQDNDDVIEWALLQRLEKEFSKMPTADVEEVIRCVECGFRDKNLITTSNNIDCYMCKRHHSLILLTDFCSYGKRSDT